MLESEKSDYEKISKEIEAREHGGSSGPTETMTQADNESRKAHSVINS